MLIKPTASFYKKLHVTSVTRVTSLINKGLQRVTPQKIKLLQLLRISSRGVTLLINKINILDKV
jgi:hypothetical protein